MKKRQFATYKKEIKDLIPGDLWVQEYFGGTVVRMFVSHTNEPGTETLWDDIHETHFEERYIWTMNVVMGSSKWLKTSDLHIDAYPQDAKVDVINFDPEV
jgi:hypothetical protein